MPAHTNNAIAEMIGVKNIEATKVPIAPPTPVSPMPTVAYSTPRKPPIAAEITAHTRAKIRFYEISPPGHAAKEVHRPGNQIPSRAHEAFYGIV